MAIILVVDDDFILADTLSDYLIDGGHEVGTASNGALALASIRQARPDLIVTDFMMPDMNGLELAEALRSDPRFADLPIILLSGAQAGIGRSRPDLFQAVFQKPYRFGQLMRTVEAILNPL